MLNYFLVASIMGEGVAVAPVRFPSVGMRYQVTSPSEIAQKSH